jgi:AAA family ATP:ADP antiporter
LAKPLFRSIGTGHSLLVGAALVLASLGLALVVDRRATGGTSAPPVPQGISGPRLLLRDRYLALIALLATAKNGVNALGEYLLDRRLLEAAGRGRDPAAVHAFIANFKADYLTYASVFGLLVQLALVPRLLGRLGAGRALCLLPLLVLFGYGAVLVVPLLALVLCVKVAENGTDYSLQKTAEQALFLVTSRAAKYKAKAIIDTVFVRAGDIVAALLVAGAVALAVPFRAVVGLTLLLGLGLLTLSLALARRYRALARRAPTEG